MVKKVIKKHIKICKNKEINSIKYIINNNNKKIANQMEINIQKNKE